MKREKENIVLGSMVCRKILSQINKRGFDYAINISKEVDCGWSNASMKVQSLKEEGLVEDLENNGKKEYPFVKKDRKRKYVKLTEKGKRIVELLSKINMEMEKK